MRIVATSLHTVNIPLVAPTLWVGGVNKAWTRTILRLRSDEGLEGIAETDGSAETRLWRRMLQQQFEGGTPSTGAGSCAASRTSAGRAAWPGGTRRRRSRPPAGT